MDAGTIVETEIEKSFSCRAEESSQPTMNGFSTKKRKHEVDLCSTTKKHKNEEDSESRLNLIMLPDDVLLIILSYLKHHSLAQLRSTCTLFARLCEDYTLWRRVDYSDATPNASELDFIAMNVNNETKSIHVLGSDCQESILTPAWFDMLSIKCSNLAKLSLPNYTFDCRTITIDNFPPRITYLDLSNTNFQCLPEERSYFKDISSFIPNLKVLILSNCAWFEPHSLMAISKCKHLEELRLNDCVQVKDCLAYCGLSTRGGFQTLKTLDLRRCSVSNSELVCFSSVPTLKNLYLESTEQSTIFIDPALIVMCAYHLARADGRWEDAFRQRVQLERLAIRNYPLLTDGTLMKLAQDAHTLVYLDVTGSGVTKAAIERFRAMRPQVTLIASVSEEN